MLLRARRPFLIGGKQVSAGEVIDLDSLDLPSGRAQKIVNARLGEYVVTSAHSCDLCEKTFASSHAVSIHKSRSHRDAIEEN
ncbi:hypothetical protein UFOVP1305_56 [uncultured Caudovirales phage]|uniref:C2H2-type domain-containing protein n=2 Tax=uncultured Caudovirales phage TaxID=2100421 RepID=A0A6J5RX55_9CAUD|nr:hypothetical protein UFOVP1305_56 [uncultured Caudovirales phage]